MVAPCSLRRQVGSCKGRISLGSSAAGFLPIQTRRSMEGPRTWSMSSGFRSAAYQTWASRPATKRAPGWYSSYGSPSTWGAL
eukprot:1544093-Pyramimonas_sp.AAC.1